MDYIIPGNQKIIINPELIKKLNTCIKKYTTTPVSNKNLMMEVINIIRTKFHCSKISGLTIRGIGINEIKANDIPIAREKINIFLTEIYTIIYMVYEANKNKFQVTKVKRSGYESDDLNPTEYFDEFIQTARTFGSNAEGNIRKSSKKIGFRDGLKTQTSNNSQPPKGNHNIRIVSSVHSRSSEANDGSPKL